METRPKPTHLVLAAAAERHPTLFEPEEVKAVS